MLRKIIIILSLFATTLYGEEPKKEKPIDINKVSETLGHLLIKQLNNDVFKFNIDKIVAGMKGAMAGKTAPLSESEYEEQIVAIQEKIFQKTAEQNLEKATAFLQKNEREAGVITLSPQLQYKIVQEGEANTLVSEENTPKIHYTGTLLDGSVFATSKEANTPLTLPLKNSIAGFTKGIVGMKKGEKRILYIHPELAHGLASHLPPNSLLVFEVEVLETNAVEAPATEIAADVKETQ